MAYGRQMRKDLWMYVYQTEQLKVSGIPVDQIEFVYAIDEAGARAEAEKRVKDGAPIVEIELKRAGTHYAIGRTILDEKLLCNLDGTPKDSPFHGRE